MEAAGTRYILYSKSDDRIKLWCLADLHLGNIGVDHKLLEADLKSVREDPYAIWVGGGDYAEYISPRDRRFDAESVDPKVIATCDFGCLGSALTDEVTSRFAPLSGKCLGLAYGNHESKYMKEKEQQDLHASMCVGLHVPNLRYSAMMHLRPIRVPESVTETPILLGPSTTPKMILKEDPKGGSRPKKTLFVHHGSGGARTSGGKQNRLRDFMQLTTADITFIGHCHDTRFEPQRLLSLNPTGTHLDEKKRMALMTGSYLKTYAEGTTGYGEEAGYPPSVLGAVWVEWKLEDGELRSEVRA